MRETWAIAAVAAALGAAVPAGAAEEVTPLFAAREPLRITIRGPISRIAAARDDPQPVDATLAVVGTAETLPVKLSARGITRRSRDICQFPPLRVDFEPKPAAGSLFRGQKGLKLVTHCRSAEGFQQHVLLEYAVYRMYNLLTPNSFSVRLANIDYVDGNGRPITSRLGFFIEDTDDAARRNGLREAKTGDRVSPTVLRPADGGRYALFQYMIGNLDWSMIAGPAGSGCCHNSKLIGAANATTQLLPMPYDFDFSGFVDAPYATPPEGIPVGNVRVRRYRGYCAHNAQVQVAAADILTRRATLLAVFDELPQLTARTRSKAMSYLGDFFSQIGTPADVSSKVLKTCL